MSFSANQGEVWDGVTLFQTAAKTASPTGNISDVFDKAQHELDEFLNLFRLHDDANGLAFFISRRLISLDAFHRTDVYRAYFPKLVRGVGMEAFHMHKGKEAMEEAEARYRVAEFFDTIDEQKFEEYRGVGVGVEQRFGSEELTGFELEYEKHVVHLTALRLAKQTRPA